MIDKIKELEKISRVLDANFQERGYLLNEITDYSQDYLEKINNTSAFSFDIDKNDAISDFSINDSGEDIKAILKSLDRHVNFSGANTLSSKYFGYIPTGSIFHSALGDYHAAIINRYTGLYYTAPGPALLENTLIRWISNILGYPDNSLGNLSSGGSISTLTALVTARDAHNIEGDEINKAVVYLTSQTHHCLKKVLHIVGLDNCIVREIDIDDNYRMNANKLEEAVISDKKHGLNPWLIVGTAGTTNTGSVDPLYNLSQIANQYGLWYHIDGAYGAFYLLSDEVKDRFSGIEKSHSIIVDPHKSLFIPFGSGVTLIREGKKLHDSFSAHADYIENIMEKTEEMSPADLSPELTRHFRGLRMWLPLKLFGISVFKAALTEKILLARYFYEKMMEIKRIELGPYPDLSIVTYRWIPEKGNPDDFNKLLLKKIQHEGKIFISSTKLNGKYVLRLAVGSFKTHKEDIDVAINVIRGSAEEIEAG